MKFSFSLYQIYQIMVNRGNVRSENSLSEKCQFKKLCHGEMSFETNPLNIGSFI